MSKCLKQPNFPQARVVLCALACGYPRLIESLLQCGVRVLEIPPHPSLAAPVRCHADLQLYHLGEGRLLAAPGLPREINMRLHKETFSVKQIHFPLNDRYPGDIALCCFALEDRLYCYPEHTAPELLAQYSDIEPVRQGYARCSVCLVDSAAIITADRGIADRAQANGVAVLRIRPGYCALPGYDYGFIGGCSGLLDKRLLAFTGDIDRHPDGGNIRSFCRERGVDILCLDHGPLLDIGGILPLREADPIQS